MKLFCFFLLLFTSSCFWKGEKDESLICLQTVDQNGLSEMINDPEKLEKWKSTDFLTPQPYKQVVRTYGKTKEGNTPSYFTTYHQNGQIWQYLEVLDGRARGRYREWFPSGKIKIEASVCSGSANLSSSAQKNWSFDGLCTVWTEEGIALAKIPYEKGSLEGKATYYYPDGCLKREASYKKGHLEGDFREYRFDGSLLCHYFYQEGFLQGTAICYFTNQIVSSLENYQKGSLQRAVYYDTEGNLLSEIQEGNGYKIIYDKEIPKQKIEYQAGAVRGKVVLFDKKGEIMGQHFLKEGKKHGEELYFYSKEETEGREEKVPKFSFLWEKGLLQGVAKTWYPNGQIASQKELFRNKKQGPYCVWYYTGELMYLEEYENDILISGKYYKKGENMPFCEVIKGEGEAALFDEKTGVLLKKLKYLQGKPST